MPASELRLKNKESERTGPPLFKVAINNFLNYQQSPYTAQFFIIFALFKNRRYVRRP
jgi:hypothetical protein